MGLNDIPDGWHLFQHMGRVEVAANRVDVVKFQPIFDGIGTVARFALDYPQREIILLSTNYRPITVRAFR